MKKISIFAAIMALSMGIFTHAALAATPTLSATTVGGSVQITVSGDVNSPIYLYYYNPVGSSNIANAGVIGNTNSSGYFSTTVSGNAYNIPSGTNAYVVVNNQQSPMIVWPYFTGGGYNSLTFSQTNVYLSINQSATVSIFGGSGSYYISSNSNSGVINATINSSNQLYLTGTGFGTAALTICSNGGYSGCGTLYVNVQSTYNNNQSPPGLSQNNLNLNVGQGQQIIVYGTGSYTLSSNSNPNVVSAYMTGGSVVNVFGTSPGTSVLSICASSGGSGCASLYVTVSGYGYYGGTNYYNNPTVYTYPTNYTYPQGRPVAGVYLSQVPSTGINFNLKVALFMIALACWSLLMAHILLTKYTRSKWYM
ncbi:MAG: hypothetical protein PHF79_00645 [Candidatus Pacebacteria bacterium]|nr:hypothetical protein [Candidatus Paceibacterota bacterium]